MSHLWSGCGGDADGEGVGSIDSLIGSVRSNHLGALQDEEDKRTQ